MTSAGDEHAVRSRRRGRPPGRRSVETRARILRAARACFSKRGYARTSLADIALEAGITPRAIYHYVESKPALFAQAADVVYVRFAEEVLGRAPENLDTRSRIRGLIDVLRVLYQEDPSLVAFLSLAVMEARRNPELADPLPRASGGHVALRHAVVALGLDRDGIAADVDPSGAVALMEVFGAGLTFLANDERGEEYLAMLDVLERLIDGTLFVDPP